MMQVFLYRNLITVTMVTGIDLHYMLHELIIFGPNGIFTEGLLKNI